MPEIRTMIAPKGHAERQLHALLDDTDTPNIFLLETHRNARPTGGYNISYAVLMSDKAGIVNITRDFCALTGVRQGRYGAVHQTGGVDAGSHFSEALRYRLYGNLVSHVIRAFML